MGHVVIMDVDLAWHDCLESFHKVQVSFDWDLVLTLPIFFSSIVTMSHLAQGASVHPLSHAVRLGYSLRNFFSLYRLNLLHLHSYSLERIEVDFSHRLLSCRWIARRGLFLLTNLDELCITFDHVFTHLLPIVGIFFYVLHLRSLKLYTVIWILGHVVL